MTQDGQFYRNQHLRMFFNAVCSISSSPPSTCTVLYADYGWQMAKYNGMGYASINIWKHGCCSGTGNIYKMTSRTGQLKWKQNPQDLRDSISCAGTEAYN